jgi:hypothetical protein
MKKTVVREYKNAHEYNKDAQKLSQQGWSVVQSTDQMKGRSATAKTAIVGSALVTGGLLAPVGIFALTHRKDHLVITYEREVPDVSVSSDTQEVLPEGLSWMQQQQWFNSHRPPGLTNLEFGQWIQNEKRAAKARK